MLMLLLPSRMHAQRAVREGRVPVEQVEPQQRQPLRTQIKAAEDIRMRTPRVRLARGVMIEVVAHVVA